VSRRPRGRARGADAGPPAFFRGARGGAPQVRAVLPRRGRVRRRAGPARRRATAPAGVRGGPPGAGLRLAAPGRRAGRARRPPRGRRPRAGRRASCAGAPGARV